MYKEEIIVPILGRGLHFGIINDYKKLKNRWFEQKEFNDDNFMHKAFIYDIIYKPDEYYFKTDGYWGSCWVAEIFDSADTTLKTYRFRNFMDLIYLFDKKGYTFIEND